MANRLIDETSPYLRQHADNPVDWYPWGEEAFERARREDKPLFVSIGYASCHWCHVMAHESFEDPETAALLAKDFISIKVDREERPDVDAVYMAAVQALTGSGGWPMSVFCTPEGKPFYAGTYFPPTDRGGLPSFRSVLQALAAAWTQERAAVERQAEAVLAAVERQTAPLEHLAVDGGPRPSATLPTFDDLLEQTMGHLRRSFDEHWGGFGGAPKFPRPAYIDLCLRHYARTGDRRSLAMATTTLDAMAAGGIYDHLAGGFARYATDRQWLVPHFEKMLTDQALLARSYLHAWLLTGHSDYHQVLSETLDYVLTALAAPGGGFCSSEDADAGGVEGGHATFTEGQARAALGDLDPQTVEAALDFYGITADGHWEGTNVIHRRLGEPLRRPPAMEVARQRLLAARRARPQPARDDKVLTEWNAMTVAALAEAAAATGNARWASAAISTAEVLWRDLRRDDGRWLRSLQGGRARHLAMAADYAWLVEAFTRLAELTGSATWIAQASGAADGLLAHFSEQGLIFATGDDADALICRPMDLLDGAVPAASSVAAVALLRLGALTGQTRYSAAAEAILRRAAPLVTETPLAFPDLLGAYAMFEDPVEIVVAGDRPDLLHALRRRWLPTAVLAWGQRTASPLWTDRQDGAAYVCRHFVCGLPARDEATLVSQLPEPGS